MHLEIHHYHHICSDSSPEIKQLLTELLSVVTKNQKTLKEIQMTDQETSDLLDQVNTTTNGIAAQQAQDAGTLTEVKTELEALLNAPPAQSGLSPATSAKLQTLAAAIGTIQTNATVNSGVLTGIAAEGKPVVPPPPPPVPAPATA